MNGQPDHRLVLLSKTLPRCLGIVSILVGGAVLTGWIFDGAVLKSIVPTWGAMRPSTALAFILAGAALVQYTVRYRWLRRAAPICAILVLLLGLSDLVQYVFGWTLGFDQILLTAGGASTPAVFLGRMALSTAASFVLLGFALAAAGIRNRVWPVQHASAVTALISLIALLGYAYDPAALTSSNLYIPMALHTALTFLLLCVGTVCVVPGNYLLALITDHRLGNVIARWLYLPAVVGPVLLGLLYSLGERTGLFGSGSAMALLAVSMIATSTAFITWLAFSLNRTDSARQHAETMLRDSEQRFRTTNELLERFFSTTELKIAYLDENFNFIRVNLGYSQSDEHPSEYYVGKNHFALFPNADNEAIFTEVLKTGTPYFAFAQPFEYAANPERGVTYWNWTLQAVRDPLGSVSGLVLSLVDVTERERAVQAMQQSEAALRAANAYNRSLIEASLDPLVTIAPDGTITDVNAATELITGCTRPELIGTDFMNYFTEPDRARAGYQEVFQRDTVRDYPLEIRHCDGHTTAVLYNASVYRDTQGQVIGIFAAARDVTARRQAEEEIQRLNAELEQRVIRRTAQLQDEIAVRNRVEADLRRNQQILSEQREQYRVTLSSIGDGVIATDSVGAITFMNPVAELLTGWPQAEALGQDARRVFCIVHEKTREVVANPITRVLDKGIVVGLANHTVLIARNGQERPIDDSGAPIHDADGHLLGVVLVFRDISEQRRAENERRAHEEQVQQIIDTVPVMIASIDTEERYRFCNQALASLYGQTPGELRGRRVHEVVYEMAYRHARPYIETALKGQPVTFENTVPAKDGSIHTNLVSYVPQFDEQGQVVGFIVAGSDITARKQAEETIQRQADLLEQAHDAIFTWELGNRILQWYHGAEVLYGWSQQEAITQNAQHLLHTHAAMAWPQIEETLRRHGGWEGELEHTTRDGRRIVVESRLSLVKYPDGRFVVLEVNRDVTNRKQAEERLLRLQEVTAALARAMTLSDVGAVFVKLAIKASDATAGSLVRLIDDRTLEVVTASNYPPDMVRAWQRFSLDSLTPLSEAVRTAAPVWVDSHETWNNRYGSPPVSPQYGAFAGLPLIVNGFSVGGIGFSFAESHSFREEDRALLATLALQCAQAVERAMMYEELQAHAQILEQTVEQRTAELKKTLARVEAADRAKTYMLSNVTHEMRTPLSSIVGFSNLMIKRSLSEGKQREFIKAINQEGRRLTVLIDDFLDLQRIEAGRQTFSFAEVDLAALVEEEIDQLELEDERMSPIRVECEPVPPVSADKERIRQVIRNLLSNALKFSPEGEIVLSVRATGSEVICSVCDNGIGIPVEELDQLFQRFYRGEVAEQQRIRGTGLGLALCREIIEAHQGRIWAESPGLNQGATFQFALPAAA